MFSMKYFTSRLYRQQSSKYYKNRTADAIQLRFLQLNMYGIFSTTKLSSAFTNWIITAPSINHLLICSSTHLAHFCLWPQIGQIPYSFLIPFLEHTRAQLLS